MTRAPDTLWIACGVAALAVLGTAAILDMHPDLSQHALAVSVELAKQLGSGALVFAGLYGAHVLGGGEA